jgi:uncharacterized protein YkwD
MAGATRTRAGLKLGPQGALVVFVAAASVVLLGFALQPGIAPAGAACRHTRAHPHEVGLSVLRRAITCLVNHRRARRDRRPLERNKRLRHAAQRHNDTMLAEDCFRHRCPGEPGLNRRVKKTGYTRGRDAFGFAENLGYDNTPRQMVRRWLHSRFNRRNLLDRDFRDIGVGVGWGTPISTLDDSKFETYTIVFGWRRR